MRRAATVGGEIQPVHGANFKGFPRDRSIRRGSASVDEASGGFLGDEGDFGVRPPGELADGEVTVGRDIDGRALQSPVRFDIANENVPFVGFVTGLFLTAPGELFTIGRELRERIRGRIRVGQTLPGCGFVIEADAADVVVGAPGLPLRGHRCEEQVFAVGREGEVVADAEGGAGGVGVAIAGGGVVAVLSVGRDDEEMIALIADVAVPVAVEEFGEGFRFHGVLFDRLVFFGIFLVALSEGKLAEFGIHGANEGDVLAVAAPDGGFGTCAEVGQLRGFAAKCQVENVQLAGSTAIGLEEDFGAIWAPAGMRIGFPRTGNRPRWRFAITIGDPEVRVLFVGRNVGNFGHLIDNFFAIRRDLWVGDPFELEKIVECDGASFLGRRAWSGHDEGYTKAQKTHWETS